MAIAAKYGLIVAPDGLQPTKSPSRSRSPSITRNQKSHRSKYGSSRSRMPKHNAYQSRNNQSEIKNENQRNIHGKKKLRTMTKEERRQKLKQMMNDAQVHEQRATERLKKSMKKDINEQKEFLKQHRDNAHNASFIKKMNKNLYMNSNETVEDRIKKYKNSRQRGNTEHHNFLKR